MPGRPANHVAVFPTQRHILTASGRLALIQRKRLEDSRRVASARDASADDDTARPDGEETRSQDYAPVAPAVSDQTRAEMSALIREMESAS